MSTETTENLCTHYNVGVNPEGTSRMNVCKVCVHVHTKVLRPGPQILANNHAHKPTVNDDNEYTLVNVKFCQVC